MSPLRLMFVTSGLERGGAESFLTRLAARLVSRGHACSIASLGATAPLAPALANTGVELTRLGSGIALPVWRAVRTARAFRPDVVQGWMYRGNLVAACAARFSSPRPALVWSVRQGLNDLSASPARTRMTIAWNARWSERPSAIVYNALSAARQHEAIGFASARTRVIPNGIDPSSAPPSPADRARQRDALGLPDDAFVIGLFARWHPVKNHAGFVRAAGLFARRRPDARFLLAGAGIDAGNATLNGWLRDEGIAERCLLLGDRDDIPELLAAVDVVTLTSLGEAFPNSLLEAMGAGIPCAAPDVGDVADLIGDTGAIVAAGDVAALAAGWDRLAGLTPAGRRDLGARALARVRERFSLDRAAESSERLYAELERR